jgi:DNA-binding HxlR family transcriptional regulator
MPGDILSVTWLYEDFLPSLSDKEQQALEETINEMINEGLIKYVDGPKATYALTQKGKDILC